MIQKQNRNMSFSLYISAVAVADTMVIASGKFSFQLIKKTGYSSNETTNHYPLDFHEQFGRPKYKKLLNFLIRMLLTFSLVAETQKNGKYKTSVK